MNYLDLTIRPMDNACNLHCKYCSIQSQYKGKSFFRQVSELPIWKWFPSLLKQMPLIEGLRAVTFGWHGGEPLLLPRKLLEKAVQWQSKYLKHVHYHNFIQTNGILLDADTADFLNRIGFDVTISTDGPLYKHNQARCRSIKLFEKILNNVYTLKRKKLPFSLCIVIHEDNCMDVKDIMNFLLEMNPENGVAFPPRFNNVNSMLMPTLYGAFLFELFDFWWPKCPFSIGLFESIISGLKGRVPNICFLCGKCKSFINVDSQGNIFSTCWLVDSNAKVGNILEDPLEILLSHHEEKIQQWMQSIKGEGLFELLGSKIPYIYFQSKGCIYRASIAGGKDPYAPVFAKLIQHIEKQVKKEG